MLRKQGSALEKNISPVDYGVHHDELGLSHMTDLIPCKRTALGECSLKSHALLLIRVFPVENVIRKEKIDLCALRFEILEYSDYLTQLKKDSGHRGLKDVERYIQDHYAENLTLRDLGKMYYINSSYLGQLFHKKYGLSFKDYLNNCRINAAAEMLLKSDRKVADIAAEVGYKDIDYFVSKFIEINGCTPTKYRRNI